MFSERKVAQTAAFLLEKRGGAMSHLKLMKLLYLADREAMNRYGISISGDHMVAMPHGPVLSMTLDYMDGGIESSPGGWEEWISDKENHEVSLRKPIARGALDELSIAEIEVLEAVWNQFGKMDRWEIRNYTHTSGMAGPARLLDTYYLQSRLSRTGALGEGSRRTGRTH